MRASWIAIGAATLGSALGVGISWANFGHTPPLEPDRVNSATIATGLHRPKVVVDAEAHDFGRARADQKLRHAFHFTNVGDAPLKLESRGTTCSQCTIAEISKPVVPPGETAEVVIEYQTSYYKPTFRQVAVIGTNDPDQARVELSIFGTLTNNFHTMPEILSFGKTSVEETKTQELKVYSRMSDSLEMVKTTFAENETTAHFDVKTDPIPTDELPQGDAKSGLRALVTLKPGLPLGPVRQTIRLELADGSGENQVVQVPIEATIDSDLSIVGSGWDSEHNRLSIGAVKSAQGAKRQVFVLVRGPYRKDVTLNPVEVEPAWLKVNVGQPTDLKSGTVTQIPLEFEIPAGAPPGSHSGTSFNKFGKVRLETTHPQMKEFRIYLQFVVE